MTAYDIVTWLNAGDCHRCGRRASYYVAPYWARDRQVCTWCCRDLDRIYSNTGWPLE